MYYSAISAWVKGGDNRFNDKLDINSSDYSIVAIDGETSAVIAKIDYPEARVYSLPDMVMSVSSGKADVTFLENYIAQKFIENNPNSIKQVGEVVRLYGNAIYMKKGEHDLRLMINDAADEILNSAFLPDLFKKYEVPSDSYFMPAKLYGKGN